MAEALESIAARLERLLDRAERLLPGVPAPLTEDECRAFTAFRWEGTGGGRLVPIRHPHHVELDDLVGIDDVKDELVRNTRQFVGGLSANNVLLWGERGNGKSSCVKGLLPRFAGRGLRLVEVQRWDLLGLPAIAAMLRELPYRFILFCDDLSFGEGETAYRGLKTILEGGIEARPENVLLYATSNRRHLMPEPMTDNVGGGEIHPEEAVSEKLSLSDRFGLSLGFFSVDQDEYLAIVTHYAQRLDLPIAPDDLRREALLWSRYSGRRSGRAARQFIDDLAGRLGRCAGTE